MRPSDRKYMESHEWALPEGETFVVGITDFAVEKLGDLVFLDLPEAGSQATRGERFGEIESVKAVSDLYAPISGEIVAVNTEAADDLGKISEDPFGGGWLIKIKASGAEDYETMLDAAAYEKVVEKES